MSSYTSDVAECMGKVREVALEEMLRARLFRTVQVQAPGAGNEIAVTVPDGAVWYVYSLRAQLVTSAVAGNRLPALLISDGATELQRIAAVNNQATGLTWVYTWAPGFGYSPASSVIQNIGLGTPPPALQAGSTLKTVTAAIDVGDVYSGVALQVCEFTVGQVYWMADLLGRQLSYEDELPLTDKSKLGRVGSGQPAGNEASQSGVVPNAAKS